VNRFKSKMVFNDDDTYVYDNCKKLYSRNFPVSYNNYKFRIIYDILDVNDVFVQYIKIIEFRRYEFFINLNKNVNNYFDMISFEMLKTLNITGELIYKNIIVNTLIYIIKLYNSILTINDKIIKKLHFYDNSATYNLYFLFIENRNNNFRKNNRFRS